MASLDTLMHAWDRSTGRMGTDSLSPEGCDAMRAKLSVVLSVMTVTVVAAGMAAGQAAAASPRHHLRGETGRTILLNPVGPRPMRPLVPKIYAPKWSGEILTGAVNGLAVKRPTVPFYKDSFTYQGKTYPY